MERFKIGQLFQRGEGDGAEEKPESSQRVEEFEGGDGALILIVDDAKTIRHVIRKILRQVGHKTLQAEDGQGAIDMAREHKPDLIIMDIVMPGMNGFQATREIRKDPEVGDTPIIIMSGNPQATEQYWVMKIGANDFISKPFTRVELLERVSAHLKRGSRADEKTSSSDDSSWFL